MPPSLLPLLRDIFIGGLNYDRAFAFTDDLDIAAGAVYDGRGFDGADAAIDNDIYEVVIALLDELGVGEIFGFKVFVLGSHRSGNQRGTEFLDDGVADGLGGDSDTDGLVGILVVAGHIAVGIHDEGGSTGKGSFYEGEEAFVHRSHEVGHLGKVGTEHREFGLFERETFELGQLFDRLLMVDAAGKGVERVGGYNNDCTVAEGVGYLSDFPNVGVVFIEFYYHKRIAKVLIFFHSARKNCKYKIKSRIFANCKTGKERI